MDTQSLGLSSNQLASNSAMGVSTDQPEEYITTDDFEAAIRRHYRPLWLGTYDFNAIVNEDMEFYGRDLPPFISPATIHPSTPTRSSVPEHTRVVGGGKIRILPHQWERTTKVFEVAVVNGKAFVVKCFFTRRLQDHYKVWFGHRQGFFPNAFLFPARGHPTPKALRRVQTLELT